MGPVKCNQSRAEPEQEGENRGLAGGWLVWHAPRREYTNYRRRVRTAGGEVCREAKAEAARSKRRLLSTEEERNSGPMADGDCRPEEEKHPRRSWRGFMACAHALRVVAPRKRGHSYRGGRCPSGSALGARLEDGGSNPAGGAGSVGARPPPPPPLDPFEYWTGPPIDLSEYRWRRALLKVCVVLACSGYFFLGGGGKTDETSTRSAGIGGGAGCRKGGWFQRCPLQSSTCRGPKSSSSQESNPRRDN